MPLLVRVSILSNTKIYQRNETLNQKQGKSDKEKQIKAILEDLDWI